MKVEIVVPTINLWRKYTKPCIESIMDAMMRAKNHNIDCHLLLVDNASTDVTKTEARKYDKNLFCYHRNEERWGFQKSVNFGVKYGLEHGAEFVLVCNNDIILHPEAIWRLVERFEKEDVGMVTCMDIKGEMKEKHIPISQIGSVNSKDKEDIQEVPHPIFSAFMVSKRCWEEVGELDELFAPAYFEDNDYHYRMKLLGINAILYPPAMFYHYGSVTQLYADIRPIVSTGMFENNRANYINKWGGMPGEEKFIYPYNNEINLITSTKQNEQIKKYT